MENDVVRQSLLSWGRYLYWADLKFREWDRFMSAQRAEGESLPTPEWLGLSCYWGSSLYVVIEGWQEEGFSDPVIDAVIKVGNYQDSLRLLRNGTFHFQPELLSPKVTQFFRSPDVTLWLHFLHDEFCRWLRDFVDTFGFVAGTLPEDTSGWRESFQELVGWMPSRHAEAKLAELAAEVDSYLKLIAGSDADTPEERRRTREMYDTALVETAKRVREYRRDHLSKLGLDPDALIP